MTALIDKFVLRPNPDSKPEKMSKSRGNVITIQEVVRRVSSIKDGYEFRDHHGNTIDDPLRLEIWRDYDEQFYCGSRWNAMKGFPGFGIMQECHLHHIERRKEEFLVHMDPNKPLFKHIPVFLHKVGNDIPLTFHVGGKYIQQHPNAFALWDRLYAAYPDEFIDIKDAESMFMLRFNDNGQPKDAGIYSYE